MIHPLKLVFSGYKLLRRVFEEIGIKNGCGAVGRKVVSKSRRQRFGSDPDDFSDNLFPAKCTKDSNKEAENESV